MKYFRVKASFCGSKGGIIDIQYFGIKAKDEAGAIDKLRKKYGKLLLSAEVIGIGYYRHDKTI